jgi:hypothetical protein
MIGGPLVAVFVWVLRPGSSSGARPRPLSGGPRTLALLLPDPTVKFSLAVQQASPDPRGLGSAAELSPVPQGVDGPAQVVGRLVEGEQLVHLFLQGTRVFVRRMVAVEG